MMLTGSLRHCSRPSTSSPLQCLSLESSLFRRSTKRDRPRLLHSRLCNRVPRKFGALLLRFPLPHGRQDCHPLHGQSGRELLNKLVNLLDSPSNLRKGLFRPRSRNELCVSALRPLKLNPTTPTLKEHQHEGTVPRPRYQINILKQVPQNCIQQ